MGQKNTVKTTDKIDADKVEEWLRQKRHKACSSCNGLDWHLEERKMEIRVLPNHKVEAVCIVCKHCGKMEFYSLHTIMESYKNE